MVFRFASFCLLAFLSLATLHAQDPFRISQTQGELHGFLLLRSAEGKVIAHGDLIQTGHGPRVTSELVFHFHDGSIDDETVSYIQESTFKLVTDHHVQKGPYFPTPIDITVNADGEIINRSTDKDGKEKVDTSRLDLPPDVANGLIAPVLLNMVNTKSPFSLSFVAPAGKGRVVKLDISPEGKASFEAVGTQHTANVFRIKVDLGGIVGVVAPMVGKKPADIVIWVADGPAPVIVREIGQLYVGGPMISMELSGATFMHTAAEVLKP
jgi:hypothetical protein